MNKLILLILIVFFLVSNIVSAETYEGDGTYKIKPEDIIISDNDVSIKFVEIIEIYQPFTKSQFAQISLYFNGAYLSPFIESEVRKIAPDASDPETYIKVEVISINKEESYAEVKVSSLGKEEQTVCSDTDGGINYAEKGIVTYYTAKYEDKCEVFQGVTTNIHEYYCEKGEVNHSSKICYGTCEDGACSRVIPFEECKDSDNGKNFYEKGIVTYTFEENTYTYKDTCQMIQPIRDVEECSGIPCYIKEYYCNESKTFRYGSFKCPQGCKDGVCIKEIEEFNLFEIIIKWFRELFN